MTTAIGRGFLSFSKSLDRYEASQRGNAGKNLAMIITEITYKLPDHIASNVTPLKIFTGGKSALYFSPTVFW
jgi:hypothetical protein